jgi:hypothetical protein
MTLRTAFCGAFRELFLAREPAAITPRTSAEINIRFIFKNLPKRFIKQHLYYTLSSRFHSKNTGFAELFILNRKNELRFDKRVYMETA